MMKFQKIGLIGRFKPLHNGGALMLETLCKQAEHVIIGIGSSNKYNLRNPFTAEESHNMIDTFLAPNYSNYEVIYIPDFAHISEYSNGKKWKEYVTSHYGTLDYFISGNEYVSNLLSPDYNIIRPASLIPPEKQIKLRATEVRIKMAMKDKWKPLVPEPVAEYLEKNGLVERFRREFGLETLSQLVDYYNYSIDESSDAERLHAQEA